MNLLIDTKIQLSLGLDFRVIRDKSGYLFLKDRKYRTNYSLHSFGMAEDQILEIVRIVDEVVSHNTRDNRQSRRDISTRSLNSLTETSKQFVTRVLNLDSSSLHKFLLLTSGAYLSSPGDDDLLITLAEAKPESCGDVTSIFKNARIFEMLQETYVLPGVTETIAYTSARSMLEASIMRHSVEMIARLLTFVAKQDPQLTLAEHLKLKDNEAFSAFKPMRNFDQFSFIEEFLDRKQDYSKLGYKLTASELYSLSFLMIDGCKKIPVDFLFNRTKAMREVPREMKLARLLNPYLSLTEINRLGYGTIEEINTRFHTTDLSGRPPAPIVYAALAEVLVQKGVKRTLDVVNEIMYLNKLKNFGTEAIEATVLLILEALKPENDEMPFSWAAQLSEHAWVLNSQPISEKLALRV